MRAVVVYESMYGNTHAVAEAIGRGLGPTFRTTVVPVHEAPKSLLDGADLVVVGGPTHAHGMTRPSTRHSAAEAASAPTSGLTLEPDAELEGLREWFDTVDHIGGPAAAFDTRIHLSPLLSGQASKGIEKRLRRHGCTLVADSQSFFVEKDNTLEPGEQDRAVAWGRDVADRAAALVSGTHG